MKSAYVILINAIIFITNSINSQNQICGTTTPNDIVLPRHLSKISSNINIPVIFHVIKGNDNSGEVSDNQLTQQIDVLNNRFSGTDYSFIFYLAGINRVKNDNWRYLGKGTTAVTNMVNELSVDPQHVLNIYITNIYPSNLLGWLIDWMWNLPENSSQNGIIIPLFSNSIRLSGSISTSTSPFSSKRIVYTPSNTISGMLSSTTIGML